MHPPPRPPPASGAALTRLASAGPLHRGAGDGRRPVPDQDPLLLPGPDAGGAAAARREELPHLLPDARGTHAGGAR